jgi:hypothetical protein
MGWSTYERGESLETCLASETSGMSIIKQKAGRDGSRTLRWFVVDNGNKRFVALAICEREDGGWSIKMLDESSGPCNVDCPLEFLDGLPEPVGFAVEWRKRVREYHATKAPPLRPGPVYIRSSDAQYHNKQATLESLSPLVVRMDGWTLRIKKSQLSAAPW